MPVTMQWKSCKREGLCRASALVGLGAVDGREDRGAAGVEHAVVLAVLGGGGERDVGAGADVGASAGRALAVGGRELLVQALDVAAVAWSGASGGQTSARHATLAASPARHAC